MNAAAVRRPKIVNHTLSVIVTVYAATNELAVVRANLNAKERVFYAENRLWILARDLRPKFVGRAVSLSEHVLDVKIAARVVDS